MNTQVKNPVLFTIHVNNKIMLDEYIFLWVYNKAMKLPVADDGSREAVVAS